MIKKININYIRNILWNLLDKLFDRTLLALSIIIISRYFGPELFGTWTLYLSISMLIFPILQSGLIPEVVKRLTANEDKIQTLSSTVSLKLCLYFIFVILLTGTSFFIHENIQQIKIQLLFGLAFMPLILESNAAYFLSIYKSRSMLIANTSRYAIYFFSIYILIFLKIKELEYFIFLLFLNNLTYVTTLLLLMKKEGINIDLSKTKFSKAKDIFKNALPFFVAGFLLNFFSYAPKILIGTNYDVIKLGLYNASFQIVNLGWILPRSLSQSLLPILFKNKDSSEIQSNTYLSIFLASSLLCVGVYFLADPIVLLLFGKEYLEASNFLELHIWVIIFASMNVFSQAIMLKERLFLKAILKSLFGLLIFTIFLFFLRSYEVQGIIFSILAGYISMEVIFDIFLNNGSSIKKSKINAIKKLFHI